MACVHSHTELEGLTPQKIELACVLFLAVLQSVAASFCFSEPPKVNLDLESSASKHRKKRNVNTGRRHGIGPSNPYGRKGSDDRRQFARF